MRKNHAKLALKTICPHVETCTFVLVLLSANNAISLTENGSKIADVYLISIETYLLAV